MKREVEKLIGQVDLNPKATARLDAFEEQLVDLRRKLANVDPVKIQKDSQAVLTKVYEIIDKSLNA